MDYNEFTDKELFEKLGASITTEQFLDSEMGKLFIRGSEKIVDRALLKLCTKPVKDLTWNEVIEVIVIIRKYKFGLFDEIRQIAQEGEFVFDELKERDALNGFAEP